MKIAVCSDLHLEFGDLDLHNEENADVLILGGDIFVVDELYGFTADDSNNIIAKSLSVTSRAERYNNFIFRCSERFKHVIFIMGNHEHYHGDYAKTAKIIRDTFGDLKNVHFLDKEHRIIDNILFFGGTLWTDMNSEDPKTMRHMEHCMNDYRQVVNSNRQVHYRAISMEENDNSWAMKTRPGVFKPEDTVEEHRAFLKELDVVLEKHSNMRVVVVGHHAPSKASTHPRYKNEYMMNGAYSTNLDNFILDRRQIKLWTHGHTHEDFDYMIGTTRVVCNPRGYDGYEERADNFKLKYVEI
jgi:Icc-related predicted phosphoesterase